MTPEEPTLEEMEQAADWLLSQPPGAIDTEELEKPDAE